MPLHAGGGTTGHINHAQEALSLHINASPEVLVLAPGSNKRNVHKGVPRGHALDQPVPRGDLDRGCQLIIRAQCCVLHLHTEPLHSFSHLSLVPLLPDLTMYLNGTYPAPFAAQL